ncbi:Tim44 domain-containing protein [Myxococcota bacterium]|nr:Tim44 domain-containing protein [Myxococcota bacterium]
MNRQGTLWLLATAVILWVIPPATADASPDGGAGCGGYDDMIAIVGFVLFIGTGFIFGLIDERKRKRLDAEMKVTVPEETVPEAFIDAQVEALQQEDPGFSRIAMLDFVYGLWQETLHQMGQPGLDRLRPFYSPEMMRLLREDSPMSAGSRISNVVVRGIRLVKLVRLEGEPPREDLPGETPARMRALIHLDTSWRLKSQGEPATYHGQLVTVEFERPVGVRSRPPGPFAVTCQACGAPMPHERLGESCDHCGQGYGSDLFNWRCTEILRVTDDAPWLAAEIVYRPVVDPGFTLPARFSPSLAKRLAELEREEPDFRRQLRARTIEVFDGLFTCWNNDDTEGMRPLVGERLLGTYQYRLGGYRLRGQKNRMADLQILSMELSRIERDRHLDSVTVRLRASCLETTAIISTGKLVGGSDRHPHRFCEYWTFTRQREAPAAPPASCPKCGAGLGPVEEASCPHCGSRLYAVSGQWELAFSEQADSYLQGQPRVPGDGSSWRRL